MENLYKRTALEDNADHYDLPFNKRVGLAHEQQHLIETQVDLRPLISSPIIDQGLLNSCSACALAIAVEIHLKNENRYYANHSPEDVDSSQMFIYYHERLLTGTVDENAPVYIRDGLKTLLLYGVCAEELWPYPATALPANLKQVIEHGTTEELQALIMQAQKNHEEQIEDILEERPTSAALEQASKYRNTNYYRLSIENGVHELKLALSKGLPVVFGIMEPKSFFTIPPCGTWVTPPNEELRLGGHAMVAVGYCDEREVFIVRNSYGETFGEKGYCYMPYDFIVGHYESDGKKIANAFSFWCLLDDAEVN